MDYPIDLWREISLWLPYNHIAINKTLSSFYNENWCKDKILSQYPNCKKHDNSWEYLYKKSLHSGIFICYKDDNFYCPIKGIKIVNIENSQLILTFDGDLYHYYNDQLKLIDENVLDIAERTYIKDYEWYYFDGKNKKLITRSRTEKFITVVSDNIGDISVITNNKYYRCNIHPNNKDFRYIEIKSENNSKLIHSGRMIMLQKSDKTVYEVVNSLGGFYKRNIPFCKELYPGCATSNDSLIIFRYGRYGFTLSFTNYINVKNTIFDESELLLLADNQVFRYDEKLGFILIHGDVKNICHGGYFIV